MTKKCNVCQEHKDFNSFSKCSTNQDGLQSRCKQCSSKYAKERYERKKTEPKPQQPLNKTVNNLDTIPSRHKEALEELSQYQPNLLIASLRIRGYKGKLTYTHEIEL